MGSTLRLLSETFPPHIDLTTAPFYTTVSYFQNKSWVTLALVGYVRTKRPTWEAIRGLARSQVMISCHQDRVGILVRLGDPLRCTVPQGPPLDFSNRTAKGYQLGDDKLLLWRLSYDIGFFFGFIGWYWNVSFEESVNVITWLLYRIFLIGDFICIMKRICGCSPPSTFFVYFLENDAAMTQSLGVNKTIAL